MLGNNKLRIWVHFYIPRSTMQIHLVHPDTGWKAYTQIRPRYVRHNKLAIESVGLFSGYFRSNSDSPLCSLCQLFKWQKVQDSIQPCFLLLAILSATRPFLFKCGTQTQHPPPLGCGKVCFPSWRLRDLWDRQYGCHGPQSRLIPEGVPIMEIIEVRFV